MFNLVNKDDAINLISNELIRSSADNESLEERIHNETIVDIIELLKNHSTIGPTMPSIGEKIYIVKNHSVETQTVEAVSLNITENGVTFEIETDRYYINPESFNNSWFLTLEEAVAHKDKE